MPSRPKALLVMNSDRLEDVYPEPLRVRAAEHVDLLAAPMTPDEFLASPELREQIDVLLTGWGVPHLGDDLLSGMPKLKAVFHGAGSVRNFVSDAVWERDLIVTSAAAANAVPVAQFCLAQIILLLKQAYPLHRTYRPGVERPADVRNEVRGVFDARIGLVSYGLIARLLRDHLRELNLPVSVYDPFLSEELARQYGIRLVDLDTLFATCEVVSVHTPLLPETRGLIRGDHVRALPQGAGFLNTARGAIVNEPELCEVLQERPDLTALLDVTYPEPPLPDSVIWTLPNVVLTPHLAGAQGRECRRLGDHAVRQMIAFLHDTPIEGRVSREGLALMA